MPRKLLPLSALLCSIATGYSTSFLNGDFESFPTFYKIVYTGESIPGWRVVGGSVELVGAGLWQPSEGSMSLDTVGVQVRGAIAQDVTFDSVDQHHITFDLSRNPLINYSPVRMGVWYRPPSSTEFIGLGEFTYGEVNTSANMMWQLTGTDSFMSEIGVSTFMFVSLTGGGATDPTWGGAALDNIQLVPGESPYDPIAPPTFSTPEALFGHYTLYDNTPPGTTFPPAAVPESGQTGLLLLLGGLGIAMGNWLTARRASCA